MFLIALTAAGAGVAVPFFGKIGILIGALGGLCIAIVFDAAVRASRDPLLKEGTPMDLAGLDAQQKLAMLGHGLSAGAGDFRSEMLRAVDETLAEADTDLEAGLRRARELTEQHPRAAAVWALVGKLELRAEREVEAIEASSRAFELAAQGGLNQLLIDFCDDPQGPELEQLELSRSAWTQLAAAFKARERDEQASFALARAEAIDPELDAKRRATALAAAAEALRVAGDERAAADISDLLAAGRQSN